MKPIYKSLALTAMTLSVSLSLQGQIYDGEDTNTSELSSELLDSLRVELVAPNVSGARDLIKGGECTVNGSDLSIALNTGEWVKGATYRVRMLATFGTQTQVIYVLTVTVPYYETLSNEIQEFSDDVIVISTIGDGDKSGADATVYAKNGDGNAHVTTSLSISDGVVSSAGSVASGRTNGENSQINASGEGAVASGVTNGENSHIEASGDGAVASGYTYGENSQINASSSGTVASGFTYGKNSQINASSDGAVVIGVTNGENSQINASSASSVAIGVTNGVDSKIEASNEGAIASGYASSNDGNVVSDGIGSQAFGIGVQTTQDAQMVVGKCNVVDEDDSFQFIVGNGKSNANRSNAFAVTKSGELALFEADGTPVILDAATLKALIASLS